MKWGVSGPKGAPGAKKPPKPLRNDWFNSLLREGAPPGPLCALFPLFTEMGELGPAITISMTFHHFGAICAKKIAQDKKNTFYALKRNAGLVF